MRPIAGVRNTPVVLACALVAAVSLVLHTPMLHAKTWCVQLTGGDCQETTATIRDAVSAASDDDMIRVKAGTYPEGAVWLIKRLTLLGAQAGVDARTRPVGPGTESVIAPAPINPNDPLLVLGPGAAGSTIDGFTLLGGNISIQNGLQPDESNDRLQIRNNRLLGFWGAGIALAAPGVDLTIDGNYVDGSSVRTPDVLVSVRADGAHPYPGLWVTNNSIINGGPNTAGFGATVPGTRIGRSDMRAPLIKGNTFSRDRVGVMISSQFEDGEISDNTFERNFQDGLQVAAARSLIVRNLFFDNDGPGLSLSSGLPPGTITTNTINGNTFLANRWGAWYDGNESVSVTGNYWGAANGPYHPVHNPGGAGDMVMDQQDIGPVPGTGRLLFDPWRETSLVPLPTAKVWCVPEAVTGCDAWSLTIQGAIDAAFQGDTIRVAAGTYSEGAMRIGKQVTLRGAQAGVDARGRDGAAESIITTVTPSPRPDAPIMVLAAGAAGSTIDGFTLTGGNLGIQTDVGPYASLGSLQILNNRISGFWAAGIALGFPGEDITIDRNRVDGFAIPLDHFDMVVSVRSNGSYDGLWVTNNEIVNGRTQAHGFSVPSAGAHLGRSAARTPRITGNLVTGNSFGALINAAFGDGEISDNQFVDNLSDGLSVSASGSTIARNEFAENGIGCFLQQPMAESTISGNRFVDNDGAGLATAPDPALAAKLVATDVTDNDFLRNQTGASLELEGGTITGNVFANNIFTGLGGKLNLTRIERNVFEANGSHGMVAASPSAANVVRNNAFVGNAAVGISGLMDDSTVDSNRFANNGGNGLQVGQRMVVTGNVIEANRGFALAFRSDIAGAAVTGNVITGNGDFACTVPPPVPGNNPGACGGGISFSTFSAALTSNLVEGNTISGNRVGAVYFAPNPANATGITKDLRNNDWGAASGPYHATRNVAGTANAVIDPSSNPDIVNPGMILFDPWLATGYTPPGADVDIEVTATLPGGSTASVGLGFDLVLTAGITSVTTAPTGHTPPVGFQLGDPPVYYDVATTAAYSGTIELCFTWTEGQFYNESAIRLFHFESGAWVDVTTTLDTSGNVVCGRVTSLSPFTLMEVAYQFVGFFPPVNNLPATNVVKAGQAVPVKFGLGGNHGLSIFDAGYPASQQASCTSYNGTGNIVATVTPGGSALQYDSASGQYTYVWKTDSRWANTCRVLILAFNDGSRQTVNLQFRK
jgi:hypothetical protein